MQDGFPCELFFNTRYGFNGISSFYGINWGVYVLSFKSFVRDGLEELRKISCFFLNVPLSPPSHCLVQNQPYVYLTDDFIFGIVLSLSTSIFTILSVTLS